MDSVSSSADGNENNVDRDLQNRSPSPATAPASASSAGRIGSSNNFIGKHRLAAAINQLHLQIQLIEEELEQLDTFCESSLVCKELVSSVESSPDALLPVTKGPVDAGWDRWFQGTHSSRNRKRWI